MIEATIRYKEGGWKLLVDALALDDSRRVLTLSAAIQGGTIAKALRAALADAGKAEFILDGGGMPKQAYRHETGYRVAITRLGYDLYHCVALANVEGLIPRWGPEGLWTEMMSERYTTPLLRSWLPWLFDRVGGNEDNVPTNQRYCSEARLLKLEPAALDDLVSQGLRDGDLFIS